MFPNIERVMSLDENLVKEQEPPAPTEVSIEDALFVAIGLHQSDQLDDAEKLYRRILDIVLFRLRLAGLYCAASGQDVVIRRCSHRDRARRGRCTVLSHLVRSQLRFESVRSTEQHRRRC